MLAKGSGKVIRSGFAQSLETVKDIYGSVGLARLVLVGAVILRIVGFMARTCGSCLGSRRFSNWWAAPVIATALASSFLACWINSTGNGVQREPEIEANIADDVRTHPE